jgi:hypothetical protein
MRRVISHGGIVMVLVLLALPATGYAGCTEHNAALPPSQCVPRGGTIAVTPAQPGHCPALLVP